jgi:hypothetical protein
MNNAQHNICILLLAVKYVGSIGEFKGAASTVTDILLQTIS